MSRLPVLHPMLVFLMQWFNDILADCFAKIDVVPVEAHGLAAKVFTHCEAAAFYRSGGRFLTSSNAF